MVAVLYRRRRGQGRAALGLVRRPLDPAVGIPEAGLRHRLRLAVCRACAPARHSGQSVRHASCSALVVALLVAQPDLGQTMLTTGTWGVHVLHGRHAVALDHRARRRSASAASFAAYTVLPARRRPYRPVPDRRGRHVPGRHGAARRSINGGWFGVGPGEGTVKRVIPDSHADFVFSVAGEEFGIVMCFVIMSIFAFIVLRGLQHGAARNMTISPAMPSPAWSLCSACSRSSTWASTCS